MPKLPSWRASSLKCLFFLLLTLIPAQGANSALTPLLIRSNWPASWPPIRFPGPVVTELQEFQPTPDGFSVSVDLLKTNSAVRGLVAENGDLPERILGRPMTNFFQITVEDEQGAAVGVQITAVEPPQLSPDIDRYRIHARFTTPPSGNDHKLKVTVRNRYRAEQAAFRERHLGWLSNSLPEVLNGLAQLQQPTNQLAAILAGLKNTRENDPAREAFSESATEALRNYFDFTPDANGDVKALARPGTLAATVPGMSYTNYLSVFRDDITESLFNTATTVSNWLASVRATVAPAARPAPPAGITAALCTELFWTLAYRFHRFSGGIDKRHHASEEVAFRASTREFNWSGRIAGFAVLVEKLEPLPEKEVASNFGRGIANHFHVFRVALLNTNAASVLLYGDQISLQCRVREFTFNDPKDFRKLVASVPERDLHVDPLNGNSSRSWKTSQDGRQRGRVRDVPGKMLARPYTLNFLIRGYDDREFNTTKARIFRSLNVVGDAAAALIPFVGKQGYSDGSGIFSGVFVPATKKLFGDATEVQRQTFLLESMPPYVELDRGQSVSKYIYFPKYGLTGVAQDKVLFLTEFGDAQTMEVKVALLIKPDANSPTSTLPSVK